MIIKTAYQVGDKVYIRKFPYGAENNFISINKIRAICIKSPQESKDEFIIDYWFLNDIEKYRDLKLLEYKISASNHEIFHTLKEANMSIIGSQTYDTSLTPDKYSMEIQFAPGEEVLYYPQYEIALRRGKINQYLYRGSMMQDCCIMDNADWVITSRVFHLEDLDKALNAVPVISYIEHKINYIKIITWVLVALVIHVIYVLMR